MTTSQPLTVEPGIVNYEIENGVATITFSHPKSNSMPGVTLAELTRAVTTAGGDSAVRVILLRSTGEGAFCAGASFAELQALASADAGRKFFMGFANLIIAMIRCPRLIVTRVHGKAVGGGVGIVAASDYAIASGSAAIRLSELAVGLGPFIIGPAIERKIGSGAFGAMAIDADWRDARWAYGHGLYAEVHDDVESLYCGVGKRGEVLSGSNPDAMMRLKRALWEGTEGWADLLETRAGISGSLAMSEFTAKAIGRRDG